VLIRPELQLCGTAKGRMPLLFDVFHGDHPLFSYNDRKPPLCFHLTTLSAEKQAKAMCFLRDIFPKIPCMLIICVYCDQQYNQC
jgi:hypothetical protein